MTGDAEFNEVYFTDVRVPDSMRLDDVGRGWAVSITTLMNERVSIGGGTPRGDPARSGSWSTLGGARVDGDPVQRDRVAELWIQAEVNRLTNMRAAASRARRHSRAGGIGGQARDGRAQQGDLRGSGRPDGTGGDAVRLL